jgi:hypothetical protein
MPQDKQPTAAVPRLQTVDDRLARVEDLLAKASIRLDKIERCLSNPKSQCKAKGYDSQKIHFTASPQSHNGFTPEPQERDAQQSCQFVALS